MRLLPVINDDGTFDPCTVGIVQAYMMFPDDEVSIEEDVAAFRYRFQTGFRPSNLAKQQQASWRSAQLGGMYAGDMLMMMVQFHQHQPALNVGMNKSAFAAAAQAKRLGGPTEKNLSTIKKYWKKYKNAAHLWAAFMLEFQITKELPLDFATIVSRADGLVEASEHLIEDWDPWRAPLAARNLTTLEVPKPDAEDVSVIRKYAAPKVDKN